MSLRCYFCGRFVSPNKTDEDGVSARTLGDQATCDECDRTDEDIREMLREDALLDGWEDER